jgi:hypothetical protein
MLGGIGELGELKEALGAERELRGGASGEVNAIAAVDRAQEVTQLRAGIRKVVQDCACGVKHPASALELSLRLLSRLRGRRGTRILRLCFCFPVSFSLLDESVHVPQRLLHPLRTPQPFPLSELGLGRSGLTRDL